jgi:hypothetical protein
MDGWMEVKAVLRIAYSNQKLKNTWLFYLRHSHNVCFWQNQENVFPIVSKCSKLARFVKCTILWLFTYETLIIFVSDRICELCSRLSPQSSRGVLSRSFQGQTRRVAAGQPRSKKKYFHITESSKTPQVIKWKIRAPPHGYSVSLCAAINLTMEDNRKGAGKKTGISEIR